MGYIHVGQANGMASASSSRDRRHTSNFKLQPTFELPVAVEPGEEASLRRRLIAPSDSTVVHSNIPGGNFSNAIPEVLPVHHSVCNACCIGEEIIQSIVNVVLSAIILAEFLRSK